MAVRQDFEKMMVELKDKIAATKDEFASRPLIAKYIYLKFEYEKEETMTDTPENQSAIDRMKKDEWTPEESKRLAQLKAVIGAITLKGTISNLPLNERMYEFVHSFPVTEDYENINFNEEQRKIIRAEAEELRREDVAYLANHPEDIYNAHGLPSNERYAAINKKWRLVENVINKEMYADMSTLTVNGVGYRELFAGMRFNQDADNRQAGVFCAFLMAKKGMTPDKALTYGRKDPGYQEALKEFAQFLYDNRVAGEPPLTQKQIKERTANVLLLMQGATESLNKWKMPDIDYTDPAQIEQHKVVLMKLADLTTNFNQEFENFTKHVPDVKAVAVDTLGSRQAFSNITKTWTKFNNIGGLIQDAYQEYKGVLTPNIVRAKAQSVAFSRGLLGDYQKMFRGKTFGEYMQEVEKTPFEKFAGSTLQRLINAVNNGIPEAAAKQYISGENKDAFEKIYSTQRIALNNLAIENFNDTMKDGVSGMFGAIEIELNSKNLAANLEEVMADDISPQESYRRMKNSPAGEGMMLTTSFVFDKFTTLVLGKDDMLDYLNKSDLETIKIDGKTPIELYGEKYAFIENDNDREIMFRAEVIKAIVKGEKSIVVENYALNADAGKLERVEDSIITYSKAKEEDMTAYIMEVNDLHDSFVKVRNLLKQYQKDPKANFSSGVAPEGSEFYRNMVKALNKCIEKTTVKSNQSATADDIQKAMLEYQKAAAIYHKERKGTIIGPITDKGKIRLGVADDAQNFINQRCDKLNILSRSFYTPMVKGESDTPSIKDICTGLSNRAKLKGENFKPEKIKPNPVLKGKYEHRLDDALREMDQRNKNLDKNPVYRRVMSGKYKYPLMKWNEIQEKTVKIIENAQEHLDSIIEGVQKENAEEYEIRLQEVEKLENPLTKYVFGDFENGVTNDTSETDRNEIYDRATEVITAQILANKSKRILAQGIAYEGKSLEDFREVVHDFLVNNKALNYPFADSFAKLMEENKFKDTFMNSYLNKQAEAEKNNQKNKNMDKNITNNKSTPKAGNAMKTP